MKLNCKIINQLKQIEELAIQREGKRVVLCHGHFNVIHPGHWRFLHHAREHGDILVVALLSDQTLMSNERLQHCFKQEERAISLANVPLVNVVVILDMIDLSQLIEKIQPDTYIMGKEFEEERATEVQPYIEKVESYGGAIIFHSGDVHYASADLLYDSTRLLREKKISQFINACDRHGIHPSELKEKLAKFKSSKILVIGDTIVDQYVACDPIGMSAEAPVINLREMEQREFCGGASIVASDVHSLGSECHFISVLGDDQPALFVREFFKRKNLDTHFFVDYDRPTTFKIRYMVGNQKMLRISRLQEHSIPRPLEKKIISRLKELIPSMDGVVVSDFVYGVITPLILRTIVDLAIKHKVKLFGDLQCSSQIGNVLKFKKFDLITPTEREARIALNDNDSGLEKLAMILLDKTKATNVLITLGPDGLVAYDRKNPNTVLSQHFPALISNPVDVTGAGDALLSAMAVSNCAGLSCMESAALGSCVAALAVNRIGNIPVTIDELTDFLGQLESQTRHKDVTNEPIQ